MNEIKINHGAVWVSVIWLHILGFLWYGPLFGDAWMEAVGLTQADAESGSGSIGLWVTNLVASAGAVYMLAWVFTKLNVQSIQSGLINGVLIAFFFYTLPKMSGGMFAQTEYYLAWLDGGFQMVGWGVSGLILGVWTKKA